MLQVTTAIFSGVALICLILSYTFYKSVNGILRKLMMWYFFIRACTLLFALLYYYHPEVLLVGIFRVTILIPELLVMTRILYWLKFKK